MRRQLGIVKRDPSQSEVGQSNSRTAFVKHDVPRLHVAMNHPLSMSSGEAMCDLGGQLKNFHVRKLAFLGDVLFQRLPGDVLHHQKRYMVVLLDRVNRQDIRMTDGGRCSRLSLKSPTRRLAVPKVRPQNLDRNSPLQVGVDRLPDDPHTASTNPFLNRVLAQCLWRLLSVHNRVNGKVSVRISVSFRIVRTSCVHRLTGFLWQRRWILCQIVVAVVHHFISRIRHDLPIKS